MAGTNFSLYSENKNQELTPVIILVGPQLGENIGTTARAMLNCGFTELRIVNPREGWPNEKAVKASSGADIVIDNVKLFSDLESAVMDLKKVYATTARTRDMVKPVQTAELAAQEMFNLYANQERVGIVFGPEKAGLTNADISLCDMIIDIPLNPAFKSLNLAQAVLLVCYQFFQQQNAQDLTKSEITIRQSDRLAEKQEVFNFFERLEDKLDRNGFLRVTEKKEVMMNNIRNLFLKAELTHQEVKTLHGIIESIEKM